MLTIPIALLLLTIQTPAAPPKYPSFPTPIPKVPNDPAVLAAAARQFALAKLPSPLVEKNTDWGKQKAFDSLKFDPKHPLEVGTEKKLKNDGLWKNVRVEALNPAENLKIVVDNVQSPEPGLTRFQVKVQAPVRVDYHQQHWQAGVKLYSAELRARCTVGATLQCEMRTDLVWKGLWPELDLKFKVAEAKVGYDQFVVEHALGLGGEAAKILGNVVIDFIKQVKPSVEKDLLEKANAAVLKAGKERDIRLAVGKYLGGTSSASPVVPPKSK